MAWVVVVVGLDGCCCWLGWLWLLAGKMKKAVEPAAISGCTTPTNWTSRQATALANRHWSQIRTCTRICTGTGTRTRTQEVRRLLLSIDVVSEQTLQQRYCFHMGFQCSRVCTETTSSDNNVAVGRRRNPTKPPAEYCFCMGFRC